MSAISSLSKQFVRLSLLAAMMMMLAVACGGQPESAAQNSQQLEGQIGEGAIAEEDHQNQDESEPDQALELSAANLAEGEKLTVVATTNIVGDLVRNVGGDMIELITMLPSGSDPHTFDPAPQDVAAVADAHVVFVNGLHLEEFLEELIENAGGQAPAVALSANVETRNFEESAGHAPEGVDPHVWMTPANAVAMVHNIEHALSQLDPANAETYQTNAQVYQAQLEELDAWVKTQIESIPTENRKMVTDHDAFGYYAGRYGLDLVGAVIPAYSTNAEPSAQEMADLQQAIKKFDTKAIFVGTTVNPTLAQRLADDTDIKLVPLYTGSLGQAGSGVESYLDFIRYNTTAIVNALK